MLNHHIFISLLHSLLMINQPPSLFFVFFFLSIIQQSTASARLDEAATRKDFEKRFAVLDSTIKQLCSGIQSKLGDTVTHNGKPYL